MDIHEWDQMTDVQKHAAVNRAATEPPRLRRCGRCDRQVSVLPDQAGVRFGSATLEGALTCSDCMVHYRMEKTA